MRYKTFPTTEESSINEFLKEHSEKIINNGLSVFEDRVVFLLHDDSKEERERKALVEKLRSENLALAHQLARQEIDKLYWQGQALRGDKSYQGNVVDCSNRADEIRAQIKYTEDIITSIEKGELYAQA